MRAVAPPKRDDIETFLGLINEYRYDFDKLVYIIFPFGEPGHPLEHKAPYAWQLREWRKLSLHLKAPATRYETYRLIVSSGNGAAKTAFGAMTVIMLLYTQQLRARITANTQPQLSTIVWPEYDIWFRHARFVDNFFEKFGTSIKARDPKVSETWRLDAVTWDENTPSSISGLHNEGKAMAYIFEEAPGIPAVIWQYASGAFTEKNTIKIWLAFGNSDDPESKFEQNMTSPLWHSLRFDTRTLDHIDPNQIRDWLIDAGGNEDDDDFRVRVRGLPRKSAKDSIISLEAVNAAIDRGVDFDMNSVASLPSVLGIDPAWTGGDETVLWHKQGHVITLLERYRLKKEEGQDHRYTYERACWWERKLKVDRVFVDQGEGTPVWTFANNDDKGHYWELISFGRVEMRLYFGTNKDM